ncbi:uncharacterized protein MELLADRAFT_123536 [Melampsora larici-populina 98AG31]|uniref:AB hydrolase-1 domain-containing protein n=1 Tax=Melampsora larici-populina (strain 98AG31 / pathotype 3-4-7) TaxID=747676 RepID=F4SAF5_MELLP|nr:uncharacterized protein MELLADRAFT_123536 [Melampsora larici-populina 98AG31]EGF98379.1 hypothetical protein MELLADRAFT_123536 [Melampsora larici-populina 98AG31]
MISVFRLPDWVYHLLTTSVWFIVPWSWFYCIYYLLFNKLFDTLPIIPFYLKPHPILFSYALLELSFSIYYFYQSELAQRRLQAFSHPPHLLNTCLERVSKSGLNRSTPDESLKAVDWALSKFQDFNLSFPSSLTPSSSSPSSSDQSSSSFSVHSIDNQNLPYKSDVLLEEPLSFEDPRAVDLRAHQVIWFGNCEWDEIWHDNMLEWLAWTVSGMHLHELDTTTEGQTILKALQPTLKVFENRAGSRFPLGYNPQLRNKVMRLTLDPIKVTAHPLALYAFTNITSWSVKQLMISRGFVEAQCVNRSNGLLYLIRKPPGWDELPVETRTLPFVFIHGLGIGLVQYTRFLNYLSNSTWARSRPIMILLQPSISLSFFDSRHLQSPSKPEMMLDMTEALRQQNFDQTGFELLGHSNGTMIAAWLINSMPNLIKRVCLIDPVCFCLWEGNVCHNFLYAEPRPGFERLLRYFVATELGIAKYLHRHFDWAANILWVDEIPNFQDPKKCKVFLAGKDVILNPMRIRRYLTESGMAENQYVNDTKGGLTVVWDDAHGQIMVEDGPAFKELINWLESD